MHLSLLYSKAAPQHCILPPHLHSLRASEAQRTFIIISNESLLVSKCLENKARHQKTMSLHWNLYRHTYHEILLETKWFFNEIHLSWFSSCTKKMLVYINDCGWIKICLYVYVFLTKSSFKRMTHYSRSHIFIYRVSVQQLYQCFYYYYYFKEIVNWKMTTSNPCLRLPVTTMRHACTVGLKLSSNTQKSQLEGWIKWTTSACVWMWI